VTTGIAQALDMDPEPDGSSGMRVLLVEDEPKVARFIERGLREERFTVDVAEDGEAGFTLALTHDYDLIVLDANLPRRDGFSVLAGLRAQGLRTRVLMLTARRSVEDRVRGLEGGADDYLTKPFAFAELLARLRVLLRRGGDEEPIRLAVGDLEMDLRARRVLRGGETVVLTPKEFAVLEYLLRRRDRLVTRTDLAEHVWDQHFDPGSNVIEATIYRLREKVDRGGENQLIQTTRGVGYTLRSPDAAR